MRRPTLLACVMALPLGIGSAWADPRCARLGQPTYTAMRWTSAGGAPAAAARVSFDGARLRLEAPGPGNGQLVTLVTPELHAIFLTTAQPPVALRLAVPAPPPQLTQDRREREERGRQQVTFITELRGASGQWHPVERNLCRRDGVLLEAWQWQPNQAGGLIVETRQSDIRMTRFDPALFRLPAGFRLTDPPPAGRR